MAKRCGNRRAFAWRDRSVRHTFLGGLQPVDIDGLLATIEDLQDGALRFGWLCVRTRCARGRHVQAGIRLKSFLQTIKRGDELLVIGIVCAQEDGLAASAGSAGLRGQGRLEDRVQFWMIEAQGKLVGIGEDLVVALLGVALDTTPRCHLFERFAEARRNLLATAPVGPVVRIAALIVRHIEVHPHTETKPFVIRKLNARLALPVLVPRLNHFGQQRVLRTPPSRFDLQDVRFLAVVGRDPANILGFERM